jgi:hypothetical protein
MDELYTGAAINHTLERIAGHSAELSHAILAGHCEWQDRESSFEALVKLRPRSTPITNLCPAEPMKGAFMITDVVAMLATLGEAQQTVLMVMEATVSDSGFDSQTLADLHT